MIASSLQGCSRYAILSYECCQLSDVPLFLSGFCNMNEHISPPGPLLRLLEGRAGLEAAQLMLQLPILRFQAKRGNGEPVLVLPGFMADDNSTIILRQYLNSIGYVSRGWGLGTNAQRMMDHLPGVLAAVREMHDEYQQKVRLIGWSRGGILSREIARDYPELIERVITIGSPVKGGAGASSIGRMVTRQTGLTPAEMNQVLHVRQRNPITVPIRSIYSKLDGVVAWRACIDETSPDVQHFETRGTHIAMGASVEVFRLLPKLLHPEP
jgi:hypothetical protein